MSSVIETKYTEIRVDTDNANGLDHFGYIAIQFNPDGGANGFFMDTYDMAIVDKIREFFQEIPNYNLVKDIYIEDAHVMVNLSRVNDKVYAPDIVKIVKAFEKQYHEKIMEL